MHTAHRVHGWAGVCTAFYGVPVPAWICVRCGVQYPDTDAPPPSCPICEDEREAVPPEGQRWTHPAELGREHRTEIRTEEPGLTGIGVTPEFGIGQRALLVATPAGNVLWDCVPLLDEPGRRAIDELGGLSAICLSHPHFYAAHLEFAEAFDAPVFLPGPTSSGSRGGRRASSCSTTRSSRSRA